MAVKPFVNIIMQRFKSGCKNKFILLVSILMFLNACKTTDNKQTKQMAEQPNAPKDLVNSKVENNSLYTIGDEVNVDFQTSKDIEIKDVEVHFDKKIISPTINKSTIQFSPGINRVGRHAFSVVYTLQDSTIERDYLNFVYRSDIVPEKVKFELIATYPHDAKAYTQGLFYQNGFLYESTGHKGQSSVRKVAIKTGKIEQLTTLEAKYFGEGLTLVNKEVFQITYTSQKGFVYDLESLKPLREVHYQIMEGWGLTYNGTHLLMSDGSAKIYFIEDQYFAETKRQEVYDNKGMVANLNELEYVDGLLYANVYGDKNVVVIDPETGKVVGNIDFSTLFPKNIPDDIDHVLNGIAFNPETKNFYFTGKYWPVLYEVKLLN